MPARQILFELLHGLVLGHQSYEYRSFISCTERSCIGDAKLALLCCNDSVSFVTLLLKEGTMFRVPVVHTLTNPTTMSSRLLYSGVLTAYYLTAGSAIAQAPALPNGYALSWIYLDSTYPGKTTRHHQSAGTACSCQRRMGRDRRPAGHLDRLYQYHQRSCDMHRKNARCGIYYVQIPTR